MSAGAGGAGGWLVRLDRAGRAGTRLALLRGRATLGRHLDCDVRVLQPGVAPLHADLLVHANQTIIRNMSETGCTLVNGQAVSVAALQHNDVITIGDRQLRWEYAAPPAPPAPRRQPAAPQPGNASGKQVAIVQPQRRDTHEQNSENTKESNTSRGRVSRGRSSGKAAPSPAVPPSRLARSPAASPSILSSAVPGSADKSPTKRQVRTPNTSFADTSASKRASRASPAVSPSKRQSSRSNEPSPAKKQSRQSIEPSLATADVSLSKRASRSTFASPTSPKRQSTRSNEPSPAAANKSLSKSVVSPASKRQSTRSAESSPAPASTSPSKRSSRASFASLASPKRQSTRSNEPSPSANTSLSKRTSRASAPSTTVSPRRPAARTPAASPRQVTLSSEPSPADTSQSKSPTKRQSRADVSPIKRQSKSPIKRRSIRTPDASPAFSTSAKRKSSIPAAPKSRQSRTSTPVPSAVSPVVPVASPQRKSATPASPKSRQSRTATPVSILEGAASTVAPSSGSAKRKSSKPASPKGRKSSRTLTPASSASSPAVGRTPGRSSVRVSIRTPLRVTPLRASPQSEPRRRALSAAKSTPLRLTVLRRAQSAARARGGRVTKIQAPTTIDHTKQAALLLMTGRAPAAGAPAGSARRSATGRPRRSGAGDAATGQILILNVTPLAATPRKSALKDPSAKKSLRKTDSIKFDLSNLDNYRDSDVVMLEDSARDVSQDSASEEDITLHYSETSSTTIKSAAPSPRRSIHSRSSRMLEQSGATIDDSLVLRSPSRSTVTAASPSPRSNTSVRGSVILQKTLGSPDVTASNYSRRSSRTATDQSWDTTTASAFRTRTMSPRNQNLESYSIVDLVSVDDSKSDSVYDSVGSTRSSSIVFGTPRGGRQTCSTIDPAVLTSSTPYVKAKTRSNSSPNVSTRKSSPNKTARSSGGARRSQSLSATPDNTRHHISVNSTRMSRASRSKSRINESDLQYVSSRVDSETESPKSSRKSRNSKSLTLNTTLSAADAGDVTPENSRSPEETGTPVLSIQSLLDSSRSSLASQQPTKRGRPSKNLKRKTIGVLRSEKKGHDSAKSKSLIVAGRKSLRSRNSPTDSDKTDESAPRPAADDVTPKSAVKLVPEAVKNKHSTAKKPQSKRSIIDNLNESYVIKQLFNSPVKRKLSQSMTEFSRRHLLEDDDLPTRRPTRNTVAMTGRTPDNSLLNQSAELSPERFVSPLSTPGNSPNLSGIKRLFRKNGPDNDLTNITGVKNLLRTPPARKSVRNDLTRVSGVKAVFAKSPRNRLSDVRVKEIFAEGPKNELTRLSGVRSLFQVQKNDLTDVRGVKKLFTRKSVANDLGNVSGVKQMLRVNTPNNDLRDVRGVRKMFQLKRKSASQCDVSGIEELFNESNNSHTERNPFVELVVNPQTKAKSKSYVAKRTPQNKKGRRAKSLYNVSAITDNVEQWIQDELKARTNKKTASPPKARKSLNSTPAFKPNVTRELQKLVTDTVEGTEPVLQSRIRNSSLFKTQQKKSASEIYEARTLPIKKRSIAEASLEKSTTKSTVLPIKKRAVVHSTPVKGRYNLTMNASELGRVSPIVPCDKTAADGEGLHRSRQQAKASPNARSKASPKAKPKSTVSTLTEDVTLQIHTPASPKPRGRKGRVVAQAAASPKPTRGRRRGQTTPETTAKSPKSPDKIPTPKLKKAPRAKTVPENNVVQEPPKTGRTRNNTEKQASVRESPKLKGRRAAKPASAAKKSPVKKSPVHKSPKPATPKQAKRTRKATEKSVIETKSKASPKKTRAKANDTPKSPAVAKPTRATRNKPQKAETNTKRRRSSLVIFKKPPVLSPKPAAKAKKAAAKSPVKQATPKPVVLTRRRRGQTEAKPTTPQNTRAKGTKTSVVITKPSPVIKPQVTREIAQESGSRNGRSTRNTKKVESMKSPKSTRNVKKAPSPKQSPKPPTPSKAKRGRKPTEKLVETGSQRGRKMANKSVEEAPSKRSRKAANESKATAAAARKGRKVAEKSVIIESKAKKNESSEKLGEPPVKRGRKNADKTVGDAEPTKRARAARGANKTAQQPTSKSKAAANKSADSAPARGRKTRTEDKIEPAPAATRKRKNLDEQSNVPAKLKKTEKAGGKKTASPAKEPARARRPAGSERVAAAKEEQAKPARGKTRAAPPPAVAASAQAPAAAAAGRAASGARRRR